MGLLNIKNAYNEYTDIFTFIDDSMPSLKQV